MLYGVLAATMACTIASDRIAGARPSQAARLTVADLVRSRLITLTRHGRTKLAETDVLREKAQKGFEAAFGRTDSESLREALRFLTSDGFSAAFDKALSRSR